MAPTACKRMLSGTISLASSACFSPFPHGTRPLSVSREYLALPDGPGYFAQDSSCPALLRIPLRSHKSTIRGFHPLRPCFPACSDFITQPTTWSYYPATAQSTATVWALPRSLATTEGIITLFSSPTGTKMFQFPAFASPTQNG